MARFMAAKPQISKIKYNFIFYIIKLFRYTIFKYSYDIYKINLKNSIIAVIIYSVIMIIINVITYQYNNYLWFIWAFNGILNWTISIIADYHLFRSKIFEYTKNF